MSLNANKIPSNKKKADPLESGTYPARLVQVIDLGLQKQEPYKGEEKEPHYMIYTTYELVDEFLKDEEGNELSDKPRWLSETLLMYSLQADRAKSTQRYLSLDPDQNQKGEWSKLLSSPIMLSIVQNTSKKGTTYNKIVSTATMRQKEADKLPDLVNPEKVFDLDSPDMEIFFSLPDWLQEKIKENLNYGGSALEKAVEAGPPSSEGETKKKVKKGTSESSEEVSDPIEDEDEDEDW